jgi:hypothetical protein
MNFLTSQGADGEALAVSGARDTITALRAEVERLTGIVDGFTLDPDYLRLRAENERLRAALNRAHTEMAVALSNLRPNSAGYATDAELWIELALENISAALTQEQRRKKE